MSSSTHTVNGMTEDRKTPTYRPHDRNDVSPWIIGQHTAEVIDWLTTVFDAEEVPGRLTMDDGAVAHAEVRVGDSVVLLFDKPDWRPTPAFLRVYTADIESTFARALEAGGRSITRPTHLLWGDMVGRVADPHGNVYWLMQRIEDVDEAEMASRMDDPVFAANMAYVTSADFGLDAH